MRVRRSLVLAALAAAVGLVVLGFVLRRAGAPRSIVLVTIDTLRADRLGAYGREPSLTPHLDALAKRGVVFERAWTTAPITLVAHTSILTALDPPLHGLRINHPPAALPPPSGRPFPMLAEELERSGYATGAFVSAAVLAGGPTGLSYGFDVYDEVPHVAGGDEHAERRGEETVEKALAWAKSREGPLFLWVHLFDPHWPYDAPGRWGAGREHESDAAGYDAEVRYADHCVGVLLEGLKAAGHADAVVVVAGDHGEGLGEHDEPMHGHLIHEATLRVPLIVASPGLAAGRRGEPVSLVDVLPTSLALAGRRVPGEGMSGRDLFAPGSAGETATRSLYAETIYAWHSCRWAQTFALRKGDMKIVASGPRTMLFDLAKDPREERAAEQLDATGREALAQLLAIARKRSLAELRPTEEVGQQIGYVGGVGAVTEVIPDEENAKLPSPYGRMGLIRRFEAACVQLGRHKADEALSEFDALLREDPRNLQFAFWRAQALEKTLTPDQVAAAAAYRHAFELGFRSPQCVAAALRCSVNAPARARLEESERAIGFLRDARGKGVRDDAEIFLMEAFLRLHRDELGKCEEALERARKAAPRDASDTWSAIARCASRLEEAKRRKG